MFHFIMFAHMLSLLLTRPLYHLFLAGPSRPCTRLSFSMAFLYLVIFGYLFNHSLGLATEALFQAVAFPFASFGLTTCHYSIFSQASTPLYQNIVGTFFQNNSATLTTFANTLSWLSIALATFTTARFYMLVIARAHTAGLSTTFAAAFTLGLQVLAMFMGAGVFSLASILIPLWVLYLATLPPTEPEPIPTQPTRLQTNFTLPLQRTFSLSNQQEATPRQFLLGLLYLYLPLLFLLAGLAIQALVIRVPFNGIDSYICHWALFSPLNTPDAQSLQTSTATALKLSSTFSGLTAIANLCLLNGWVVLSQIFQINLIASRLRHIGLPRPLLISIVASILLFPIVMYINTIHGFYMGSLLFYALCLILALIKPYKNT